MRKASRDWGTPPVGTVGFQAVMWPVSEAKMNRAGALRPPAETMKVSLDPLNTCPVGAPPGMATVSGRLMNGWNVPPAEVTSPL